MSLERLRVTPTFDRNEGVLYVIAVIEFTGESHDLEKATSAELAERVTDLKEILAIQVVEDAMGAVHAW